MMDTVIAKTTLMRLDVVSTFLLFSLLCVSCHVLTWKNNVCASRNLSGKCYSNRSLRRLKVCKMKGVLLRAVGH